MALIDEWKNEAELRLRKRGKNTSALFPSCPVCHKHDFEYDNKTGRLKCRKCGFETHLKVV
jgi:hypothetical protein